MALDRPPSDPVEEPGLGVAPSRGGSVAVKIWLPLNVAEWYQEQAQSLMKPRATHIRDVLVAIWKRNNG